jgi:hypothetical protein
VQYAAFAIGALAIDSASRDEILDRGGLGALLELLEVGSIFSRVSEQLTSDC